ncbi:Elongation of very long chain fatty acids protein 1 [Halotydeus destructor]|nr:Elongation of very long chain fatty acids protein 1 [Halotydeus destructor]
MAANTSAALFSRDYILNGFWDQYGDPRVAEDLPGGPWKVLATVIVYLAFVLQVGPSMMKNRKAYELKTAMKYYNIANVIFNGVFCVITFYFTSFGFDCWSCEDGHIPFPLVKLGSRAYLALKIFDLLDTVFFILRKKDNQVTVLHVVHHSIMPFTAFCGFKYAPSTVTALTGMLNTFVHTVMYYYYYLAAEHKGRDLSTIKKSITIVQLIQFVIILCQAVRILTLSGCTYPKWLSSLQMVEAIYFLIAFSRFYKKTYIDKPRASMKKSS